MVKYSVQKFFFCFCSVWFPLQQHALSPVFRNYHTFLFVYRTNEVDCVRNTSKRVHPPNLSTNQLLSWTNQWKTLPAAGEELNRQIRVDVGNYNDWAMLLLMGMSDVILRCRYAIETDQHSCWPLDNTCCLRTRRPFWYGKVFLANNAL